jgi:hypothetical protein
MTIGTDDLRRSLAEAADQTPPIAGEQRLAGVRARVRTRRRRRQAAASLAVTAAVAGVALAAGLGPAADRSAPAPAVRPTPDARPSPAPSSRAAVVAVPPFLHGLRRVMGDVVPDGEPASVTFPWDAAITSVVAQCDIGEIEVRLAPGHVAPDAPRDLLLPCTGKGEPEVGVIPRTLVRHARPGKPFESLATPVGAARGRPYAVALMTGHQVVDLSLVHDTHGGYSFREAIGFADGQPGGRGSAEPLPDGALPESPTAPVRLPSRATRVRVTVHCQGAGRVTITGDRGPVGGPVSCPADRELYRRVEFRRADAGTRIQLGVDHAASGSYQVVGVATR